MSSYDEQFRALTDDITRQLTDESEKIWHAISVMIARSIPYLFEVDGHYVQVRASNEKLAGQIAFELVIKKKPTIKDIRKYCHFLGRGWLKENMKHEERFRGPSEIYKL